MKLETELGPKDDGFRKLGCKLILIPNLIRSLNLKPKFETIYISVSNI